MNSDDTTSAPNAHHLSDKPTAVSLGNELDMLRDAIQGARLIADLLRHNLASDDGDAALAPHACSAVLSLVECRLRLVVLTITDQSDPVHLGARHNLVRAAPDGLRPEDILLPVKADRPSAEPDLSA